MGLSKYKVEGRLDGADGGTVRIHRETGLIAVRPKGRHRVYELLLADVAQMIIERVVRAEVASAPKEDPGA